MSMQTHLAELEQRHRALEAELAEALAHPSIDGLQIAELKPGKQASADDLLAWCKQNLAGYKCPRHVVFTELPKTSTGKIQKFKLREMAKEV